MASECVFCDIEKNSEEKILLSSDNFIAVWDSYPVSPGHILIITKEHRTDYFDLNEKEYGELNDMIRRAKEFLLTRVYSPDGYNIGMNCGGAAGQTIMHFHCHVIPRYSGDMEEPRGGVRHCIPNKGRY